MAVMPSPYPVTRRVGRRGLTQRKLSPGIPGRFTFSLSIVLSLSKHPLYASGRKYAVYRWRKSAPDQKASNPVQPEATHYGKEEDAPSVDSASGTGLSPRSRRADRQSLRTRPANHPIKASPKNRRGGKSK